MFTQFFKMDYKVFMHSILYFLSFFRYFKCLILGFLSQSFLSILFYSYVSLMFINIIFELPLKFLILSYQKYLLFADIKFRKNMWRPPRKSGLTPKTIQVIEWLYSVLSSPFVVLGVNPLFLGGFKTVMKFP